MKEHTFSAESWHYWIANFGAKRISMAGSDICSYIRAFLVGLVWFIIVASIMTIIGGTYTVGLLWGVWWFITGMEGPCPDIATVTWLVTITLAGIVGAAAGGAFLWHYMREKIEETTFVRDDSFLGVVAHKVHSKTCFKINFKEYQ